MEKFLKKQGQLCTQKTLEHSFVSKWYSKASRWLNIFLYIAGIITTSSLFSTYFNMNNTTAIATLSSTINLAMSGLNNKLNLKTKSEIHNSICISWGELERDIDIFLVSSNTEEETQIYLEKINKRIKELMIKEIHCPNWAAEEVKKIFAKKSEIQKQDYIRNRVRIKTLQKRQVAFDSNLYKKILPSLSDTKLRKIAKSLTTRSQPEKMSRKQLLDYLMLDLVVKDALIKDNDDQTEDISLSVTIDKNRIISL